MKMVAIVLVAAFALTVGASLAFAECAGHTKAQLVKNESQEQISTDQPTGTPFVVAEKVPEPVKPAEKSPETAKK